jgi:hypothetical protein
MESSRPAVDRASAADTGLSDARAGLGPGSLLLDEVLLAPSLSFKDLACLSRAATWLLPYRTQVIKVKIGKVHSCLRDWEKEWDVAKAEACGGHPSGTRFRARQRHLRAIDLAGGCRAGLTSHERRT